MKSIIMLFFIVLAIDASGQIAGRLRTAGGQPVGYANITLLRAVDSATVRSGLADSTGYYLLERVPAGSYFLRSSSIGYLPWSSAIFSLAPGGTFDAGVVVLSEDKQQLNTVVVRGRPRLVEQTIEGTVIHAENSVMTKGSSILDVLERSPGVQVDHHNNVLMLDGKAGVSVMINGKVQQLPEDEVLNMLANMPADNLDKVELLTTPPARYDAAGSAGLINIVLKKGRLPGTNGSFSITGGYGWREKGSTSINLDHRQGPLDWYGSYSFNHNRTIDDFYSDGSDINPALGPVYHNFWNVTHQTDNNHSALIGLDVTPGHGFTVGGSVTYNYSGATATTHNRAFYTLPPDSVLSFDGYGNGLSHWNNLVASIHAEKEGPGGRKLGIGADWIDYSNDHPTDVSSSFTDPHGAVVGTSGDSLFSPEQRGYSNTHIRVGVGKIDYSQPVWSKVRLEAGVKGTYTHSSSISGIESLIAGHWVSSLSAVNDVSMREGIGAVYTSLHAALRPTTTLDIGVRYEYSRTRLTDAGNGQSIDDRRLGVFFPSVLLSHRLNDHSQLQLSYTKRITRPSYKALSSFVIYNDPLSVFTGNPLLQPTITNNVKLGYTNRGYSLSLLFSRDDNAIISWAVTSQPGSQLVYIRPENLLYQNSITFQAGIPLRVANWWEMNLDLLGSWRQFKVTYTLVPAEKTYFAYTANARQTFTLPRGFTAELTGWYNSLSYFGSGKTGGYGSLDLGFKKQLKGNAGSLQFSAADVLRTMNIKSYLGTVTTEAFHDNAYVSWNAESRRFPILRLTYSRSFGTGQKTHNSGSAGEERERIQ